MYQLWNDIKTDDLEEVNKNLLKNLRKMANDSPVVKVKCTVRASNIELLILSLTVLFIP